MIVLVAHVYDLPRRHVRVLGPGILPLLENEAVHLLLLLLLLWSLVVVVVVVVVSLVAPDAPGAWSWGSCTSRSPEGRYRTSNNTTFTLNECVFEFTYIIKLYITLFKWFNAYWLYYYYYMYNACVSIYISLSIHIYIYIHNDIYVCIYIYIL